MLIRNYGLYWRVELVSWGRQNDAGSLLGVPKGAKRSSPIDFRDQAGIYVLYEDHKIIYIGQTGGKNQKLFARLRQHRSGDLADRWNMFSWFGTRQVIRNGELKAEKEGSHSTLAEALNHIEAILITACEPPLNRQGGRWGNTVKQYIQYENRISQPIR